MSGATADDARQIAERTCEQRGLKAGNTTETQSGTTATMRYSCG